jgi:hypothetical protein
VIKIRKHIIFWGLENSCGLSSALLAESSSAGGVEIPAQELLRDVYKTDSYLKT